MGSQYRSRNLIGDEVIPNLDQRNSSFPSTQMEPKFLSGLERDTTQ